MLIAILVLKVGLGLVMVVPGGSGIDIREDADSRTGGIFIRDTARFLCDSLNYESQFIE